jgi:hypothetical protein
MMTVQKGKYYIIAGIDLFILQIHRWESLDENLRTGSLIIGILVGIATLVKFIQDIRKNRIESKLKELDLQRKQEETRRFFEEKYRA